MMRLDAEVAAIMADKKFFLFLPQNYSCDHDEDHRDRLKIIRDNKLLPRLTLFCSAYKNPRRKSTARIAKPLKSQNKHSLNSLIS